ncbi:arylesterase [Rubrivirga sp. IMCC45206]|uniref:arylesterase n=1 Tax=Rubrivirga sp. IMCC45206 TaxID=3391614 RepID=UPI00398F9AD2
MRTVFFALALLAAGCGDAPEAPADTGLAAEPGATATPESRTTPDVPAATTDDDTVTILFFGDSLTAGYGLPDPDLAYPALVGARLSDAGVPVEVVNAGISGETSAGGRGRIAWALKQTTPDIFVLALGANDGLRGLDPDAMRDNLGAILSAVREAAPDARLVVAGMEAMPNYGADYVAEFRSVFPEVADAHGATLIPFLLDGVAGQARLNQSDGVHPTAEGQRIIAATVAEAVVPLAERVAG